MTRTDERPPFKPQPHRIELIEKGCAERARHADELPMEIPYFGDG
jgi:hypothetical protein